MNYRAEVRYTAFPGNITSCAGMVVESGNGEYVIAINTNVPQRAQLHALLHETAHLLYGHLNDPRPVEECEEEANRYADRYIEKYGRYCKEA